MAIYAISEATLTALADEIRSKVESSEPMTPQDMIDAVHSIVAHTRDVDGLIMRTSTYLESMNATEVAEYSMFSNQALTEVKFPAVKAVGEYAFCSCGNLETVTTDATKIEAYAFYGCDRLKNFTWADGITEIGTGAFDGCAMLQEADLRNSELSSIGASAFANSGINVLKLPENRICTIPNVGVFAASPIGVDGAGGVIYVPLKYRVRYEANAIWSRIFSNGTNRVVTY